MPDADRATFGEYAEFYDLYYAQKPYAAEVDELLRLFARHTGGAQPASVLDLGCGSGRHLAELARRGIACAGVDRSLPMLEHARRRLTPYRVPLHHSDLTEFRSGRAYDLVISMFAVMGYLTSDGALAAGLATVRSHLAPGGLFIFDGWHGPAVLAQGPEPRRHEYSDGGRVIVREAASTIDPTAQCVIVEFRVTVRGAAGVERQFAETHRMRFFLRPELERMAATAGLELVDCHPSGAPAAPLTTDTWNATFILRPARAEERQP